MHVSVFKVVDFEPMVYKGRCWTNVIGENNERVTFHFDSVELMNKFWTEAAIESRRVLDNLPAV